LKTILIVDNDLGFVAFLSKSLTRAGYVALPAMTSQSAIPLLEELANPKVDLLVVNLGLPSTAHLATTLQERNPSQRIISVEDPILRAITNIPVDASLPKLSPAELEGEEHWLVTVSQVLGDSER